MQFRNYYFAVAAVVFFSVQVFDSSTVLADIETCSRSNRSIDLKCTCSKQQLIDCACQCSVPGYNDVKNKTVDMAGGICRNTGRCYKLSEDCKCVTDLSDHGIIRNENSSCKTNDSACQPVCHKNNNQCVKCSRTLHCNESYVSSSFCHGIYSRHRYFCSETDLISNAVLRAIFWIMGILALCGNSVVFVTTAIKWQRSSLTPVKRGFLWFILNLSLSDALMSIYLLGISTQGALLKGNYIQNDYRWRSSNICTALGSLALLSSEACVFLMAVMTTFRLASVYFPFYMSDCSSSWYKLSTSLAWLCAAIITIIPIGQFDSGYFINAVLFPLKGHVNTEIAFDKLGFMSFVSKCTNSPTGINWRQTKQKFVNSYTHFPIIGEFGYFGDTSVCMPKLFVKMGDVACEYSMFLVILNLVMFMYMAICYLLIYKVSTRATTTRITGECKKLQKRIVILVVTDFCCWVPVCVMACCSLVGVKLHSNAYVVSAGFLLPINSALNPIIYSKLISHGFGKAASWLRGLKVFRTGSKKIAIPAAASDSTGNYAISALTNKTDVLTHDEQW